jgi:hypothetical protein
VATSAADKMDDFELIAGCQGGGWPFGPGDDASIVLDCNPVALEGQGVDESLQGCTDAQVWELAVVSIDGEGHCSFRVSPVVAGIIASEMGARQLTLDLVVE